MDTTDSSGQTGHPVRQEQAEQKDGESSCTLYYQPLSLLVSTILGSKEAVWPPQVTQGLMADAGHQDQG